MRPTHGLVRERSRSREWLQPPPPEPHAASPGGAPSSAGSPSASAAGAVELHVLYACPLDPRLPQFRIRDELDQLADALRRAQCSIRVRVGVATTKSLAQLLTLARAGARLLLHLSAHVVLLQGAGPSLVLENGHGGPHFLHRPQLEELLSGGGQGQLDGLGLVVLNSCWSEGLAQLLVESGVRHVIATRDEVSDLAASTFTQQFYYALGSKQSVLASWESARQVLRVDQNPQLTKSADQFVLFGQRGANATTLSKLEREATLDGDASAQDFCPEEVALHSRHGALARQACALPPRVEDFIGRSAVMREILSLLTDAGGRRMCVVSGPQGIGKTAVAVELAHFASSPGRTFSGAVVFVSLQGLTEAEAMLAAVSDGLRSALPDARRDAQGPAASREVLELQLRRAAECLEQQRKRPLLIIDDAAGALRPSGGVRDVLVGLLEATKQLCIAAFCRGAMYDSLGSWKCVNVLLQELSSTEAAELFLRRIHRPLRPCDLQAGAGLVGEVPAGGLSAQLSAHPLLQHLGGHPGRVRAASELVTPGLRSIFELCAGGGAGDAAGGAAGTPGLARAMSVDEGPGAGRPPAGAQPRPPGTAGPQPAPGPGQAIGPRAMSCDEVEPRGPRPQAQGHPLGPRAMSFDETPPPTWTQVRR